MFKGSLILILLATPTPKEFKEVELSKCEIAYGKVLIPAKCLEKK